MKHITDSVYDLPDNTLVNNELNNRIVVNNDLPDNNNDNDEDIMSISSEDSDESDYLPITATTMNNVPRRRYRSEVQKLRDGLSQTDPPSRFRSGRRLVV